MRPSDLLTAHLNNVAHFLVRFNAAVAIEDFLHRFAYAPQIQVIV
jgi:hypothetical protein